MMNDNNGFENRLNQATQNENQNMQDIQKKDNLNKQSDFYKQNAGLGPNARREDLKGLKNSSKSPNNSSAGKASGGGLSTKNSFNAPSSKNTTGLSKQRSGAQSGSSLLPFGNPLARRNSKSLLNNPLTRMLPGGKAANALSNVLNKNKRKSMFSAPFGIDSKAEGTGEGSADADANPEEANQGDPTEPTNKKSENRVEEVSIRIPFKIKIALIISACSLAIFISLLASIINTDTIQKLIANRFSISIFDDSDSAADVDSDGNNSGEWVDDDAYIVNKELTIYSKTNFIDDNKKSTVKFTAYKSSKDVDLSALKEYYKINCTGEDCENTAIFKFYRKLYDIYFMYKNKYSVKIDLALIMSTLNYNTKSQEDMFNKNQGNYDIEAVRENDYNNENITVLDWEIDFKKLDGYKYLNANDFRYDMQILAKHMVTKNIEYKCKKNNETKDKKAKDIETSNYESKLKCDKGYTLDKDSIKESYKYDKDKYNDFLLEYIEHKFYMEGSEVDTSKEPNQQDNDEVPSGTTTSNSLASAMVKRGLQEYENFRTGKTSAYTYQSAQGLGSGDAWCAAFVSYVSKHASYKGKTVAAIVGHTSNSTGDFMQHFYKTKGINFYYNDSCTYLNGKNGKGKYTPKPGDYIFFDWDKQFRDISQAIPGTGPQDHTAMVRKYKNGRVYTIEGNNGNAVRTTSYPITDCEIIGYGSWY